MSSGKADAPSKPRRRGVKIAAVALGILAIGFGVAAVTMDRWIFELLDPGPFDPAKTPPRPDYTLQSAWAALPELEDDADVALPEDPAIDPKQARVDVFYLHPTTAVEKRWNAPFDDPQVIEATARGGTSIQASAFNGCCAVYAPRYRQANGRAFTLPDAEGQKARDVAFEDIRRAFESFRVRSGGRPFILAGHSQGAILGARLLHEEIAGREAAADLVAAYLPGAPLEAEELDFPLCATPRQVGCVASWHARGPSFEPNQFEFNARSPNPMAGRVCVNPISWSTDGAHASASSSLGAVFFDAPKPVRKPEFVDAQCRDGTLVTTPHGDLERDFPSRVLLWAMGPQNYHPIEYQLFYEDIRRNARDRVAAFLAK